MASYYNVRDLVDVVAKICSVPETIRDILLFVSEQSYRYDPYYDVFDIGECGEYTAASFLVTERNFTQQEAYLTVAIAGVLKYVEYVTDKFAYLKRAYAWCGEEYAVGSLGALCTLENAIRVFGSDTKLFDTIDYPLDRGTVEYQTFPVLNGQRTWKYGNTLLEKAAVKVVHENMPVSSCPHELQDMVKSVVLIY